MIRRFVALVVGVLAFSIVFYGCTAEKEINGQINVVPKCPVEGDWDCDMTPDADDDCPYEYGAFDNQGCPNPIAGVDTDGDGVVDGSDACPMIKGSPYNDGCPVQTQECLEDRDCDAGEYCSPQGVCEAEPTAECRTDEDCPVGYECDAYGECVRTSEPECYNDDDCASAGYYCVNDFCVPNPTIECYEDRDCSGDLVCVDNECVTGGTTVECEFNSQCALDEECVNGICVPLSTAECYDDSDCPSGYYCSTDNQCYASNVDRYPAVARSVADDEIQLHPDYLRRGVSCVDMVVFDKRTTPYPADIYGDRELEWPTVCNISVNTNTNADGYMSVDTRILETGYYYRFSYRDCQFNEDAYALYGDFMILELMEDPTCVWCGRDTKADDTCSLVMFYHSDGSWTCEGNL